MSRLLHGRDELVALVGGLSIVRIDEYAVVGSYTRSEGSFCLSAGKRCLFSQQVVDLTGQLSNSEDLGGFLAKGRKRQ